MISVWSVFHSNLTYVVGMAVVVVIVIVAVPAAFVSNCSSYEPICLGIPLYVI